MAAGSASQRPATSHERPATSDQPRATSDQQPATSKQMIDLRPFRALHYDPARIGALADVIAPPYDVIDQAQLDRLYARSPYNVVRLILNRSANRYGAAATALADWRGRGVLVQDRDPALYYYVQDFSLSDRSARQRSGLMAAVRLEPFAAGNILPHER